MPRRHEIRERVSEDLISLQDYGKDFSFKEVDIEKSFEKWALAEVSSFDHLPDGMEAFTLVEGWYAVFVYHGLAREAEGTFRYIFSTWLPSSGFELDQRPHFEVLGPKYRHDSIDSEEEIYIPIRSGRTSLEEIS